jgi:hypothetical protein
MLRFVAVPGNQLRLLLFNVNWIFVVQQLGTHTHITQSSSIVYMRVLHAVKNLEELENLFVLLPKL